ncbi:hypothetical protein H0537_004520 [Salmonella enterica]|nr:hypothetical protein [Salmonella enterica]EJU7780200.1 hypothetical protein [Salmonella enterica subsp. arizonae serovar 56:z36:-]EFR2123239.1 hypothetical protein [Salmonella enterica]EFR2125315.1 hypothetical protein [Salmonella enterica]EJU7782309.1 hypothetical protein [Salmonella enterica subsp. arizonae serovar 56:z36:-]
MYLAWALPLLFPFLRKIDSKAGIQKQILIIFAFLRNLLQFAVFAAPGNWNDHSKLGSKLICL